MLKEYRKRPNRWFAEQLLEGEPLPLGVTLIADRLGGEPRHYYRRGESLAPMKFTDFVVTPPDGVPYVISEANWLHQFEEV